MRACRFAGPRGWRRNHECGKQMLFVYFSLTFYCGWPKVPLNGKYQLVVFNLSVFCCIFTLSVIVKWLPVKILSWTYIQRITSLVTFLADNLIISWAWYDLVTVKNSELTMLLSWTIPHNVEYTLMAFIKNPKRCLLKHFQWYRRWNASDANSARNLCLGFQLLVK